VRWLRHSALIVKRDPIIMRSLSGIKEKYIRLQTHLGEAPDPREDHSPAEVRRDGQGMRTERKPTERELSEKEAKGKDTRRLIVEVAERLFRQLGFQKTTVADIARELHMSPANVYRFFGAKSEINAAVCMDLLGKIELEARKIAGSRGTALQRMRNLVASVEKTHYRQYMFDRKLHELIEAAVTENWAIMREHNHRMTGMLEQIISSGMAVGEFHPGDAALAARLVNTACIRFCHPRLMAEYEQEPEPALDHMLDFCRAALARQPG
jgi:AcrR family transcriptional regulator